MKFGIAERYTRTGAARDERVETTLMYVLNRCQTSSRAAFISTHKHIFLHIAQ